MNVTMGCYTDNRSLQSPGLSEHPEKRYTTYCVCRLSVTLLKLEILQHTLVIRFLA